MVLRLLETENPTQAKLEVFNGVLVEWMIMDAAQGTW